MINPGQQLRNLLITLFPQRDETSVDTIDSAFKADGSLTLYMYYSTINYLLRRLIKTAVYLKKKSYIGTNLDRDLYIENLRIFLNTETRIEENDNEKILSLLLICTTTNNSTVPTKRLNRIISKAIEDGIPCYICGDSYSDYPQETPGEANIPTLIEMQKKLKVPEVEHLWPRSMGGSNEEFNLKVACRKCNQNKESFVDAADYHFEHICYDSAHDDGKVQTEMKFQHKLALWSKDNYSCNICQKSPEEVGPLRFQRINTNDSWHFLNIASFCNEHFND